MSTNNRSLVALMALFSSLTQRQIGRICFFGTCERARSTASTKPSTCSRGDPVSIRKTTAQSSSASLARAPRRSGSGFVPFECGVQQLVITIALLFSRRDRTQGKRHEHCISVVRLADHLRQQVLLRPDPGTAFFVQLRARPVLLPVTRDTSDANVRTTVPRRTPLSRWGTSACHLCAGTSAAGRGSKRRASGTVGRCVVAPGPILSRVSFHNGRGYEGSAQNKEDNYRLMAKPGEKIDRTEPGAVVRNLWKVGEE